MLYIISALVLIMQAIFLNVSSLLDVSLAELKADPDAENGADAT